MFADYVLLLACGYVPPMFWIRFAELVGFPITFGLVLLSVIRPDCDSVALNCVWFV